MRASSHRVLSRGGVELVKVKIREMPGWIQIVFLPPPPTGSSAHVK
jgi:hypothetical protein